MKQRLSITDIANALKRLSTRTGAKHVIGRRGRALVTHLGEEPEKPDEALLIICEYVLLNSMWVSSYANATSRITNGRWIGSIDWIQRDNGCGK